MDVKGRDLATGIPRIITINSNETRTAIQEQIDTIVSTVKTNLEHTPLSWPQTLSTGAFI
jgi:rod shape-determining protein MreB